MKKNIVLFNIISIFLWLGASNAFMPGLSILGKRPRIKEVQNMQNLTRLLSSILMEPAPFSCRPYRIRFTRTCRFWCDRI